MKLPRPRDHVEARGFTLIEVLIAVLVLSIGFFGAAKLQIISKRTSFEAMQRTVAVSLSHDIMERMRANSQQLADYTNAGLGRTLTGSTMSAQSCTGTCTPAELALYDLFEWEQHINGVSEKVGTANAGGLSSPTACISGPDGGSGHYTVAIAWRGLTKLSNPTSDACGSSTGLYDGRATGETNVHRRVLTVTSYIHDE